MRYDYDASTHVLDYDDGPKGIIEKTILGTPKPYEFAGHTFMGVAKADEYLTAKYGDYMTLPPKEKQIQHHFYRLDLNRSYKETTVEEISQ